MTTNIERVQAEDLFVSNDIFRLERFPLPHPPAAVSWAVKDFPPFDALFEVLKLVFSLLNSNLTGYRVWLLVGTSAWQPDTRVTRHYKLWGALRARGFRIPSDGTQMGPEYVLNSSEGLKFFGAVSLLESFLGNACEILQSERCSYIAALPAGVSPDNLTKIGWSGDLNSDNELICRMSETNGLLIKKIGEFDDRVRGLLVIGSQAILDTLE